MKTASELTQDILDITMTIHKCYPELSKYMDEMPVTIPNIAHPEINTEALQDYYNTLGNLLIDYAMNHKREAE